jgi:hypothetical protein
MVLRLYTNVQFFFVAITFLVESFSRILLESLSEIAHIIFSQSHSESANVYVFIRTWATRIYVVVSCASLFMLYGKQQGRGEPLRA